MPITVNCAQCGKEESLRPSWAKTYRFCSLECKGDWQSENLSGENSPQWQGGARQKHCQHCGSLFECKETRAYSLFKKQKFCSKTCADVGGFRYTGTDNTKWKDGPVKRSGTSQQRFRKLLIERDGCACRHCGSTENIQAHHVQPIKDAPALRWDIENGILLCAPCHSNLHKMKIG